jgi:uroporphyrinogen-III synthase
LFAITVLPVWYVLIDEFANISTPWAAYTALVLVPRSEIADEALVDRLAARGASVEPVVAYRTVEGPAPSLPLLRAALETSEAAPRAVVFTSGSTARGLLSLADRLGGEVPARVRDLPAVCIGPTTAAEARRLGFAVAAESASQGVSAIADAVAGYLLTQQESP